MISQSELDKITDGGLWSQDWTTRNEYWLSIREIADLHDYDSEYLEVGCYEGRTTKWLMDEFPLMNSTVIDIFEPSPLGGPYFDDYPDRFLKNLSSYRDRIHNVFKGESVHWLSHLIDQGKHYSLIYVDADHLGWKAALDGLLAFELLEKRGILIFDDYSAIQSALDAWLEIEKGRYVILYKDYQLIVKREE